MKVGGGLNYVTGPMGAGKSLYGVRHIVDALVGGRYVVTNVELKPDAFDRIARHYSLHQVWKRRQMADRLRSFYIYETDLVEAIKYRLPGRGEARGSFVWDEGHNDLNNRTWKERRDKFQNARTSGDFLLEWATQLRKLGFVGFLLSQHMDNTDVALRRVCNFSVRLQNQREQIRLLGMRATPWPLFLAFWYPSNTADKGQRVPPVKIERYFLGWHRHLYDTFGLYHGLDIDADAELGLKRLPEGGLPGGGTPAIAAKSAKLHPGSAEGSL